MRRRCLQAWLLLAFTGLCGPVAWAESCPTAKDAIATDRPDVTNSSLVVPEGSLQSENGVNVSSRDGGRTLDGTNTRLRFGVAPCLELLVDLPNYLTNIHGAGSSGFSDVSPAIKWQVSPVPGTIDLSLLAGVALPTGNSDIAGRGAQPYLQLPWSVGLRDGWSMSGMLTEFFRPSDTTTKGISEVTFALDKELTDRFSVFTEYVGDYPENGGSSQLLNSGGIFRLTHTQQLDFHFAFGLNHNSPSYIIGVGYSFRLDGLFGRH